MEQIVFNLSDFVDKLLSVISLVFSGMYIAFLIWVCYHNRYAEASQEVTIDNPGAKEDPRDKKEFKWIMLFFWMLLPLLSWSGIKRIFSKIEDSFVFAHYGWVYLLVLMIYFFLLVYFVEGRKELEEKVWEASSGGGAVTVQMSGKKEMTSIKISPEVIDPDDVEMLQDLIIAAVNEVWKKMDEESDEVYGSIGNGLGSSFSGFGF